VCGHGAQSPPVGVHPLDVDRRQRSLELAGDLDRDRDAAAGDTDDHRLVELERSDGLGQGVPGGRAISKEGRDPRNEAHAPDCARVHSRLAPRATFRSQGAGPTGSGSFPPPSWTELGFAGVSAGTTRAQRLAPCETRSFSRIGAAGNRAATALASH